MVITIKSYFDVALKDVSFDEKLADRLYKFQIGYINSNLEHLEFFGGNLLGVNVIRFKDSDVNSFYMDVLGVDTDVVYDNFKTITTINHNFKVVADPFNVTIIYIVHRFLQLVNSKDKSKNKIYLRAIKDALLIFFYRTFAALNSYYFRYPLDANLAKTVTDKLSNKYLIKKLGSWSKVCEYRVDSILDPKNKQLDVFLKLEDDYQVGQAIADFQGRIRDMYKNYYKEMLKVKSSNEILASKSSTLIDIDGEEVLGDITDTGEILVSKVKTIITNPHTLINKEIIGIIISINKNTNAVNLEKTLLWLSSNYANHQYFKSINEYLELSIIYCMNTIHNVIGKNRIRDLPYVIVRLKNILSASKVTDTDLIRIRELSQLFVTESIGKKSTIIMTSTSTALTLYITILTLIKHNG